jgi:hypothetical protein
MYTSIPITANGSYTPITGTLDCTGTGGSYGVIWYAPGPGADSIWTEFDDGSTPNSVDYVSSPLTINGTYKPFVGDFDGDGCDDVFWYAPGAGADSVWYGVPGGFTSRPVSVQGTYEPLVGDWDDANPGDDIFWYGIGGGTESIWTGSTTRGTFGPAASPQVVGTGFVTESFGNGVLFYRPGAGADYFWDGIVAGQTAPADDVQVTINGTYQPHFNGIGILLYAPGTAQDRFIYDYGGDGSMLVGSGTINGTYRVSVPNPLDGFPVILFHGPGTAPDYLWVPSELAAAGAASSSFDPQPRSAGAAGW